MRRQQQGFSLIEMMIAMVAGLIVMGATLSFTLSMIRSSTENIQVTRLSQDLRTSIGMIGRELRRAGYDQLALRRVSTGIFDSDFAPITLLNGGSCVLMGYDAPTGNRWKGFRFQDGAIQFARFSDAPVNCGGDGGWTAITNSNGVTVTGFSVEQMCGDVAGACPPVNPQSGSNTEVHLRNYRITLVGGLTLDPGVQRRMSTQIRVRADMVETLGGGGGDDDDA